MWPYVVNDASITRLLYIHSSLISFPSLLILCWSRQCKEEKKCRKTYENTTLCSSYQRM